MKWLLVILAVELGIIALPIFLWLLGGLIDRSFRSEEEILEAKDELRKLLAADSMGPVRRSRISRLYGTPEEK